MTDTQVEDLRSINSQLVSSVTNLRNELDDAREQMAGLRAEQLRLRDEVDTARACQREAEVELERFKQRITERMHREADRREWCSEYDDIMEEMGLERRSRDWNVEFRVELVYNRDIRAANASRASELAYEEFPVDQNRTYELRGIDFWVNNVETNVEETS